MAVTRAMMIASIREEFREETGEDPGPTGADVILDRRCDAFVHAMEGAGAEYAVRQHGRQVAEYLRMVWKRRGGDSDAAAKLGAVLDCEHPDSEVRRSHYGAPGIGHIDRCGICGHVLEDTGRILTLDDVR